MLEPSVVVAVISILATVITAGWTAWRFRRKDNADAESVEEGTISGRFKDADALMKYIDERVEDRTAGISTDLENVRGELVTVRAESHEMHNAVRARETQLWMWDQRGRPGDLPMLPAPILSRLGLGHFLNEDTEPTTP